MATKNPRVNVMLEPEIYNLLGRYAEKSNVSLSRIIKELILRALEDLEDRELSRIFDSRSKTFHRKNALTHNQLLTKLFQ